MPVLRFKLGMVTHTYNQNTQKPEAESQVYLAVSRLAKASLACLHINKLLLIFKIVARERKMSCNRVHVAGFLLGENGT